MNKEEQRKEFEEWLETVIYDNSDILSPSGLAWEAWQAAQKEVTAAQEEIERLKDHCRIKAKALINQTSERMKAEQQRDVARRLAEKYRNLSCDSQEEADEALLPWETINPNEL